MAIIDFFDRGWRINPTGIAYIQDERKYSFDEVGDLSCRIANQLLADGFAKGTRGAVWAGNDVTAWICTLGLWRANMTWIPINVRNAPEENVYILENFDCEVVFFQEAFGAQIAALRERLPKVQRWICLDGCPPGAESLARWIESAAATRPDVASDMDDVGALWPTRSGAFNAASLQAPGPDTEGMPSTAPLM